MSAPRHVPAATVWRIAKAGLARMACAYGDPARDDHDHTACVRDDESYAAELLLTLANAVCRDHDDHVLAALAAIQATIQPAT